MASNMVQRVFIIGTALAFIVIKTMPVSNDVLGLLRFMLPFFGIAILWQSRKIGTRDISHFAQFVALGAGAILVGLPAILGYDLASYGLIILALSTAIAILEGILGYAVKGV